MSPSKGRWQSHRSPYDAPAIGPTTSARRLCGAGSLAGLPARTVMVLVDEMMMRGELPSELQLVLSCGDGYVTYQIAHKVQPTTTPSTSRRGGVRGWWSRLTSAVMSFVNDVTPGHS